MSAVRWAADLGAGSPVQPLLTFPSLRRAKRADVREGIRFAYHSPQVFFDLREGRAAELPISSLSKAARILVHVWILIDRETTRTMKHEVIRVEPAPRIHDISVRVLRDPPQVARIVLFKESYRHTQAPLRSG